MTDRQKVAAWLDFIGEKCEETRREVIELCVTDKAARAYFVGRYQKDVA